MLKDVYATLDLLEMQLRKVWHSYIDPLPKDHFHPLPCAHRRLEAAKRVAYDLDMVQANVSDIRRVLATSPNLQPIQKEN